LELEWKRFASWKKDCLKVSVTQIRFFYIGVAIWFVGTKRFALSKDQVTVFLTLLKGFYVSVQFLIWLRHRVGQIFASVIIGKSTDLCNVSLKRSANHTGTLFYEQSCRIRICYQLRERFYLDRVVGRLAILCAKYLSPS